MIIYYASLVAVPTLIVFIFCYIAMTWSGKRKVGATRGTLVFILSVLVQAFLLSILDFYGSAFPSALATTLMGGIRVFGLPLITVVPLMLLFRRIPSSQNTAQ